MDFHLFIPITKIDIAKRLVFGTIAEEIPDHADEIMDYESAKPEFESWSAEIAKASQGRSVGNLRAMHGSVAAGRLDAIQFDDDAKRIATVAKVVDDAEWKKVLEGVYTGFSMGGHYVNRWPDPVHPGLTRYTPKPMEVSLVDHPCIPSATFEVVKSDGTVELRKFKRTDAENDVSRDALNFADPGFLADRKKRCPLDTEAHIRAAWAYMHHPRNEELYTADQIDQIKAKIVAAWKAKIDKAGPPLAAGKSLHTLPLAKDLGDVAQLALIIDDIADIANALDGSEEPLKAHLESLVALLNSLVAQATAGLTSDDDDEEGDETDEPEDEDDSGDDDALAQKLAGSLHKALMPRFDVMSARLAELTKRLEHLESQPLPGGPVAKFVTVSKAQDTAGYETSAGDPVSSFQRHLESLPAGERTHLLTKLALRNPIGR